jgi:hypothetical protein
VYIEMAEEGFAPQAHALSLPGIGTRIANFLSFFHTQARYLNNWKGREGKGLECLEEV